MLVANHFRKRFFKHSPLQNIKAATSKQDIKCKASTPIKHPNVTNENNVTMNNKAQSVPMVSHNSVELATFAISNINVGGRCKCNGHGSTCVAGDDDDPLPKCVCRLAFELSSKPVQ